MPDPRTGPRADVYRVLDAHATALLAGDEAGWLAPIDPANTKLTSRYRQLYATLRNRGITQWSYHSVLEPRSIHGGSIIVAADIVYCFRDTRCLPWDLHADADHTPPTLKRSLVMSQRDGRWLLTDDDTYGSINSNDPPWFQTR